MAADNRTEGEHTGKYTPADWTDFVHTAPGTLAGEYLRLFWQPVYCSDELHPGRSKPITVLNEQFTLYRGEKGEAHLLGFRCAHRGTQLSTGWVEGDDLRCFYHGWKYDSTGQCIEQPAEPEPFCQKVKVRSYPTHEYLGLVFAYLGLGEAPPFPRYPDFESDGVPQAEMYTRACNYYQDLENDPVHGAFVHARGRRRPIPLVTAEESEWGMTAYSTYPDGSVRVTQWGMPNVHLVRTPPSGPDGAWRDTVHWKVPIDDTTEGSFRVHFSHVTGEAARRLQEQYEEWRAKGPIFRPESLTAAILAGEMHIKDTFDQAEFYRTTVEDDVAQMGQGPIVDRTQDHLGRSDATVILFRKLWERELRALAEGRSLKHWVRTERDVPQDADGLQRAAAL